MIILGIDPGLQCTGWGIIDAQGNHLHYIDCGTITSKASDTITDRLHSLHVGLSAVVATYHPNQCAMEETYVNSNVASSLKLGQARGALLLSLAIAGMKVSEYAPTLVKKTVVGVGRAEKHQVLAMVKLLLPGCSVESTDAADSLAVAICHHSHHRSYQPTISSSLKKN